MRDPLDNNNALPQGEVGSEVGMDEAWKANIKGQFDLFLNLTGNMLKQAQQELAAINSTTIRALEQSANVQAQLNQNAVETANLTSKQAVRHADLAIDRQWNIDEANYTAAQVLNDDMFQDSLQAAVAAAVSRNINTKK